MFVVRRPFRNVHGMVPAGSIVEPAGIKGFNRRVMEGHIIEVTESNFDAYADFFKQRFGVTLEPIKKPEAAQNKPEAKPEQPKQPVGAQETKPPIAPAAPAVKPVVVQKAVTK